MNAGVDDGAGTGIRDRRFFVVVSCEHAGRDVPDPYAELFTSESARAALESHRGWDPGAKELAELFASKLGAPLVSQAVSRLLVECNRSIGHPALWSEFSRSLPRERRQEVLTRFWQPHRDAIRRLVDRQEPSGSPEASGVATGSGDPGVETSPAAVHVGVHTFTPVWRGRRRTTDIGILYDPRRGREARVARLWRDVFTSGLTEAPRAALGALTFHLNRPYRGWTDGLTTSLRTELAPAYLGFELEVSQALVPVDPWIVTRLADSLTEALCVAPLG